MWIISPCLARIYDPGRKQFTRFNIRLPTMERNLKHASCFTMVEEEERRLRGRFSLLPFALSSGMIPRHGDDINRYKLLA